MRLILSASATLAVVLAVGVASQNDEDDPVPSSEAEPSRIVLRLSGAGMVKGSREFILEGNGELRITDREPSGRLSRRADAILDEEARVRVAGLIERADMFGGQQVQARSLAIERALNASSESLVLHVRVETADGRSAEATLPPRHLRRVVPELEEIPLVTAIWDLLDQLNEIAENPERGPS